MAGTTVVTVNLGAKLPSNLLKILIWIAGLERTNEVQLVAAKFAALNAARVGDMRRAPMALECGFYLKHLNLVRILVPTLFESLRDLFENHFKDAKHWDMGLYEITAVNAWHTIHYASVEIIRWVYTWDATPTLSGSYLFWWKNTHIEYIMYLKIWLYSQPFIYIATKQLCEWFTPSAPLSPFSTTKVRGQRSWLQRSKPSLAVSGS